MDLDAEGALLSSLLIGDLPVVDEVEGLVVPTDCYSEAHRWILAAILALAEARSRVDVVTVGSWLRSTTSHAGTPRLEQVGGLAYITSILNSAPSVGNVGAYARRVRDLRLLRDAIARMQTRIAQAYQGVADVRGYLDGLEQEIAELAGAREEVTSDLTPVRESVDAIYNDLRRRAESGDIVVGLRTGFDRLDNLTAGMHDGELTVLAGRPGMGKTAFAMAMAVNVAATPDAAGKLATGVAVFSCEMPKRALVQRALASHAAVELQRMRMPRELGEGAWGRLTGSCTSMAKLPLFVDDSAGIGVRQVGTKCRRLRRALQKRGSDLRLVVVDYLQLMKGSGDNREQEVASLSRGLKEISKELSLPVLALAQLNRSVESRQDKRPGIADLRESGAVEQDADNVLFIYRDDYYHRDSNEKGLAEVIVAKQRNGPTGNVKVRFDAWCTRFTELPDGWEEGDER